MSSSPRTLADQLRGWSEQQLVDLLTRRPDLAMPAPQDSSQLASRASTRASVLRALDQLDVLQLTVLDAVVALGGITTTASLTGRVHASKKAITGAVDTLRSLALVWGEGTQVRTVTVVADVLGTSVSRLGQSAETLLLAYGPQRLGRLATDLGVAVTGDQHSDVAAITEHLRDHDRVAELVAEVDPRARSILEHLEHEAVEGTVTSTEKQVSRADAEAPVDQLLARGLLVARDRKHVAVPGEVAMFLRGGHTTRTRVDEAPELVTTEREPALVDRAAAGAGFELVRRTELLLEHWGSLPPGALRAGGLAVRDLRATAALLHLDDSGAGLHIEIAAAAGLLAIGDAEGEAAWLPTDAFDAWMTLPVAERWAQLATAWLDNPRLTGLIGSRVNNKPVNALVADLERSWLVDTRRAALSTLATLAPGAVLAPGTGTASLLRRLQWLQPRRPSARAEAVEWVLAEAAVLGVTALGGMSAAGRAALEGPKDAAAAIGPLLPEPIDHVLLQADLTAVAPGPLEPELAAGLAILADVESRGGATVFRFTASSVRRGFDSGWSAAEIHAFVEKASRTAVPQPLRYLIDDVSRRFGTLRVGSTECFLRSDDESALTELMHQSQTAGMRLRRIAPTVLISDVPLDVLLPRLRELGAAPVVEAPDGTVRIARTETRRARSPRNRGGRDSSSARHTARSIARAQATATAIRAGDRAGQVRPEPAAGGPSVAPTPMSTIAQLREAAEARGSVWIGYVDNHGSTMERVVDPLVVEDGRLSAYDHRSDEVRSFAVHRIRAVRTV